MPSETLILLSSQLINEFTGLKLYHCVIGRPPERPGNA